MNERNEWKEAKFVLLSLAIVTFNKSSPVASAVPESTKKSPKYAINVFEGY